MSFPISHHESWFLHDHRLGDFCRSSGLKLGLESHVYTPTYPYRVSRQKFVCRDLPFSNDRTKYAFHVKSPTFRTCVFPRSRSYRRLREADGLPERSTLRAAAALLSLPLCGPQQPAQGGDTWVLPCGWQGHQVAKNPPEGVWASPAVAVLAVVRGHPRLTLPPSPVLMVQPPAEAMVAHGPRWVQSSKKESPPLQPPRAPRLRRLRAQPSPGEGLSLSPTTST